MWNFRTLLRLFGWRHLLQTSQEPNVFFMICCAVLAAGTDIRMQACVAASVCQIWRTVQKQLFMCVCEEMLALLALLALLCFHKGIYSYGPKVKCRKKCEVLPVSYLSSWGASLRPTQVFQVSDMAISQPLFPHFFLLTYPARIAEYIWLETL